MSARLLAPSLQSVGRYTLTVNITGSGTGRVISTPQGIDCPTTCSASFAPGSSVSLTATPDPLSRHRGWAGACSSSPCVLTMTADTDVSTTFEPPRYAVIDLGPGGGLDVSAGAISAGGRNVAGIVTGPTPDRGLRGFVWDGAMHDLGSDKVVFASAVNDSGLVAGSWFTSGFSKQHAFRWRSGTFTDLGTLGGESSEAGGMNRDGIVVGVAARADGRSHAVYWGSSGMVDLGSLGDGADSTASGINSDGVIVGDSELGMPAPATPGAMILDATPLSPSRPPPRHPVRFRGPGAIDDLGTLGGTYGYAAAINDSGTIVGSSSLAGDRVYHGFLYEGGRMIDAGTLPGMEYSYFTAINAAGIAVGHSFNSSSGFANVVYGGGKMLNLDDLVEDKFYGIARVAGIDDAGNIVATGYTTTMRGRCCSSRNSAATPRTAARRHCMPGQH